MDSTFLFNPFTGKIVPFPSHFQYRSTAYMGFSCNPTSSDCFVVAIEKYHPKIRLCFNRLGTQEWSYAEFLDETVFCEKSPVFYQEAFYCLGHGVNLEVLQFTFGGITWEVLPNPTRPCSYHQNFLVECDGELLPVFVGAFGEGVYVFKLNLSSMEWIEVKSLGNFMIYISGSSSLAAMATTPGMENKIYFPIF
ncbi:F-box/kelch-repeat protein At1g57790-like [Herrania umbratica]|uniref:F-box/kelch-repeat protein At1g57790-like n=1 Tax=Herrania umbratica TaxID=108875 RepID=A0A6J1AMB7_9ROSI|nr:F-box/kelch-repeat protein At1g57790-like [Herrania umbratica]